MEPRNIITLTALGGLLSIAAIIIYLTNNNITILMIPLGYTLIGAWFILTGRTK